MFLLRIMTIIAQIYTFIWFTNCLVDIDERPNRVTALMVIVAYIINHIFFSNISNSLYENNQYLRYLIVIFPLLINILIYKKTINSSILGFVLAYLYNLLVVNGSLLLVYYVGKISNRDIDLHSSPLPYIFIGSIYALVFIFRKRVISFLNSIKYLNNELLIPIVLALTLWILTVDIPIWGAFPDDSVMRLESVFMTVIHNFLYSSIVMVAIMCFLYIKNMREEASSMIYLNEDLEDKLIELRKLKHDYGSEISGLYGLYKLGDYSRLEGMLKDIIDRYDTIDRRQDIHPPVNPLINSIFSSVNYSRIEISIQDDGSYDNVTLSETEIYKIISNIVRNAIEAVEGIEKPLIKYKSYNNYMKLVIEIENMGQGIPRITDKALKDIYKPGYSTKGDPSERGYGLAIAKELMDNAGGNIIIESTIDSTLFKLEIPRKG